MHSIANNVRHSLATHTLQYSDPSKFAIKINLIPFVYRYWFIYLFIFFIFILKLT